MSYKQELSEVRVGVFVCHCGSNIAGYLDCKALVEYAKTLPCVVYAQDNLYSCSESGLTEIKDAIKKYNLTRVVVASCSPRTHEPLFRSACKEAGLNPYLFEMVNIRDQCSWVHMQERENATNKAKDLIRMGVAKAIFLEAQQDLELPIRKRVAVIGGGVAGLSCAEALSEMGISVVLIEKEPSLGGMLLKLNKIVPGFRDPKELLKLLVDRVSNAQNISIYTGTTIRNIEGYVGNYTIYLDTEDKALIQEDVSAIVVATGVQNLKPLGLYGYNGKNIITQLELENLIANDLIDESIRNVVMIQCVGARSTDGSYKSYCGRICCITAIKNALLLKASFPHLKVHILYRDITAYGTDFEALTWRSRGMGINFYVFDPKNPPEVKDNTVKLESPIFDSLEIPWDLVVLSTPMVASEDAPKISNLLRIPVDRDNFFMEAHVKLRPLDSSTDGIFLCGACRFPCTIDEARMQGFGAAARVGALLGKEKIISSALVAEINKSLCCGCKGCLRVCPYGAISYLEEERVCQVNPIICKGCGACAATCPSQSVVLKGHKPNQMLAQIRALLRGAV